MHIDLDPPNGITGFPFGMPAEEVKAAAAALGRVRVIDEGPPRGWAFMKVDTVLAQFAITFHLEDGKTLTSVEIWRPFAGPEEISVTWRGIDVFRTPAAEVLARIEAAGYRIEDREYFHPQVRDLTLGFSRNSRDDIPLDGDEDDEDAMPMYFSAVLAAPAKYYD
ncbi:hypothetical protein KGQ20_24830 [Catenulispora sp. NF23]|uniref:hypothetical protein n=1 Tax=Catenulispora pinistramenti TaxID=2705254 RepID=UPI001BAD383F|nr:hypothetical protein [Catenulispora pinistramenti]MBS2535992.1 hypothetical protein [Catenulispora pinistramenti]